MKLKISAALFRCGRCNRTYANPLGHMCVTRLDRKTPPGRTTLAPKVSAGATCKCGKPLGNPLTHVCQVSTDFKRRLAASKRAAAAKPRPQHQYQSCRDDDCARIGCAAFREGRAEGYEDGLADGSAASYRAGFAAGAAPAGNRG